MKREHVIHDIYQHLATIVSRTLRGESSFGHQLTLKGDPYASGKFALALAMLIEKSGTTQAEWADAWPELIAAPCENWGKYYFLKALVKLNALGRLHTLFSQEQLNQLKNKLLWQEMVEEDTWQLNERFPTNFYGVAFSVARFRYLLGWESAYASQEILTRLCEHYRSHSSNGFSDETEGKGRYDRYSVLLIAEICQRHLETGLMVPDELKMALRQAATLVLSVLTEDGGGFLWGRSIGAYGDSAFNEILAVSQQLGLLNAQERQVAETFSLACSERFLGFWIDHDEQSVNLWFNGRRTDAYRAEHRLVGENISLCVQHLYVQQVWAGGRDRAVQRLNTPLQLAFTSFCKGDYIRGLFHWHDGERSFALPLINGDKGYHASSPYCPIPFCAGLLSGVADEEGPLWVPVIRDSDNRMLSPLVWFTECTQRQTENGWEIIIHNDAMDVIAVNGTVSLLPARESAIRSRTRYLIEKGCITREDTFFNDSKRTLHVSITGAVFSDDMSVEFTGYAQTSKTPTSLCSPYGPLQSAFVARQEIAESDCFKVSWRVCY